MFLIINKFATNRDSENLKNDLKDPPKFKFSLWTTIFPKASEKSSNYSYGLALQNLYEYVDIRKMIQRFQDIDKLKLILLNETQRKLFEFIPKPTVGVLSKRTNKRLTLEMVQKKSQSFRVMRQSIKEVPITLEENDETTRKIIQMIDPDLMDDQFLSSVLFK